MRFSHIIWRLLRQTDAQSPSVNFLEQQRALAQSRLLVRFYYLYMLYWFVDILPIYWAQWRTLTILIPLWPVTWMPAIGIKTSLDILACFSLVSALFALANADHRWWRFCTFFCFFLWYAFINSFGKISHDGHALLIVGFFFIFLPTLPRRAPRYRIGYRQMYLTVFAGAQMIIALFYTLSGLWKVVMGVWQLSQGEINTFHPYALATLVAFRLLQTGSDSLFGPVIIHYPLLGWPLYLGVVYLELFSLVAVFRPALHRLWGFGLILFHLGTWFLMGILFQSNIMLIGLLYVCSPFAPRFMQWRTALINLPLFGDFFWLLKQLRAPAQVQPTKI